MTSDEVKKVEDTLKIIGESLMEYSDSAYDNAVKMTKYISTIYGELIDLIPYLKKEGVDIPLDILVAQLNNYSQAVEKKDIMMLTDSINYEVLDTVSLYREILEQIS